MLATARIAAIAAVLVSVAAGTAGTALAGEHRSPGLRIGADMKARAEARHEGRHEGRHGHHGFTHRLRLHGLGMLQSVREDFKEMTPEDRATYREEADAFRAEEKAEWEAFIGTDEKGLREAKKDGLSMGDILEAQGHDRDDTEAFLEARSDARIDFIDVRHDLTVEEETTLKTRFSGWIEKLLDRWFN